MSSMREAGGRRGPRIVLAIVLLAGIGALFGALTGQLRTAIESDFAVVASERAGVAYLKPMSRLVIALSKAQSAAVRGAAVDSVALEAASSGVATADQSYGGELRTQQRWTLLRAEMDKVVAQRPSGAAAMARYGDLIELAAELSRRVGDTSQLILDPRLDSYYLMDSVLLQLPVVVNAAGRAADHAHLAGPSRSDEDEPTNVDVAVERYRAASATAALGASLRKAMDETGRATMSATLTEPLDVLRAAVEQLAPPAVLKQSDQSPSDAALAEAATRVRDAALPLANAVLAELDGLLGTRQDVLATQRVSAFAFAGAGVIAGVVLLWWSVPARGRGRGDEVMAPTGDDAGVPRDFASVSVQLPAVDARDLLAIEELMHIGRGVRARPRDEASDAR